MKLRILHLEDDPLDAELIARRLALDGLECLIERVDSEVEFLTALERGGIDLVLADFSLPGCDGLDALGLARQVAPEIPFVIVSGVIGEEAAVDSLRNGAIDYILKDRLSRLAPAVRRAMEDVALRLDRKSLGDQLTRAQKLEVLGELAGGVAHDYNNILTIIMANSGLLSAGLDEGTQLRKHAMQIEYACAQAAALTSRLLVFSRVKERRADTIDLNTIVKHSESMLLRLLPENIALTVSPGSGPLFIDADPGDIEQILINLVLNARDAIRGHGGIQIETGCSRKSGRNVVFFDVVDNGEGMSREVKAKIFEPFFTTKPEGRGTGLGLATCRRLVHSLRGRIHVATRSGKGTRFRVVLPESSDAASTLAKVSTDREILCGSEKILIAEDNHMLRDMMATQLEELGYRTLQASNGIEGLEVFSSHQGDPPALVVADLALPLLGGREMGRLLRKSHPDLKILHTTGHADQTLKAPGFDLPEGFVLRKPFALPELTQRIRELLSPAK